MWSPDGRYLAYHSDESGRYEIYVVSFPEGDGRWQVTSDGGVYPRWKGDGNELFYVEGDNLMSVTLDTRTGIKPGRPRALFTGASIGAPGPLTRAGFATRRPYDVSGDGQWFVMVQQVDKEEDEDEQYTLTIVQNWHAEFEDRE